MQSHYIQGVQRLILIIQLGLMDINIQVEFGFEGVPKELMCGHLHMEM